VPFLGGVFQGEVFLLSVSGRYALVGRVLGGIWVLLSYWPIVRTGLVTLWSIGIKYTVQTMYKLLTYGGMIQ